MIKKLLGKTWGWVAWLVFIALSFLILMVGWDAFYNPGSRFSSFPIDPYWTLFFGVLFAILPLLAVWFRGRLLLGLIGLAALGLGLLPILLSPSAYALLVSIWLGLVAYLLGDRLLTILKLLPLPRVDHFALALATGYVGLMLISTVLGFSRLYYSWLVWVILAGLTLFLLPQKLLRLWKFRDLNWHDWVFRMGDQRLIAWVLGSLLICGFGAYLWALAPAVRWDSLSYHIPVPVLEIQQHAIVEMPENLQSYWAHYAETLYTLGMLIEPSTALPGLLHFQMGILTTLFTFCLGRKLNGNTIQGILAALLFWSLPMVQVEAGSAYIDLFVSELIAATLYCAWIWYERQTDRWLVLTGIFAGLTIGTKLSGAFLIFGIGLWVIIQLFRANYNHRFGLKKLFLFGFCVVLFAAPWFIRDWAWTGNPIFPNYNQLFNGSRVIESAPGFEFNPTPNKFLGIVTLPQTMLFSSSIHYHELPGFALGGLSFFALPWLYPWLSRREKRFSVLALAVFSVLSIGLSIQISANFRYLIPVLPVLCILAAENFLLLWQVLQQGWLRRVALITAIVLGSIYLILTQLVLIVRHGEIAERYPYRYVLGRETQDSFLTRVVFNYTTYRFLEKQVPSPVKILSIGNELRLYTSAKIYAAISSSEANRLLLNVSSSAELFQQLKLLNYTHLILYMPEIMLRSDAVYTSPILDNEFFYQYTRPIYTHNQLTVYELIDPPGTDSVSNNLLSNPGFEALISPGLPADWELYGDFSVSSDGQHAHIGQTAICVSGPSLGASFQDVQVLPGQIYTAGYWAKPEEENQILQVYVQWLDRDKKQFAQSAEWVNLKPGWNQYQRPFTAPDNTVYARFVVSTATPGKTWVDDLCLTTRGACR